MTGFYEKGILNRGNTGRLRGVLRRAGAGEPITVGFLGGSITQGSLAGSPEACYAFLVYRWWRDTFPQARVSYVNAGIGATDSQFGAARVDGHLLRYKPDFVVLEYSVNDACSPHFQETYEGVVRKLLKAGCAVLLLHNVRYDTGETAEDIHAAVGRHYGLPCVSIRNTVCARVAAGELAQRDITPDGLHPNDLGHALVAEAVCYFLERVRAEEGPPGAEEPLPEPMTPNRFEHSRCCQNGWEAVDCQGFTPDERVQEQITQTFRGGWTAAHKGDKLTLFVEGTGIAVQYRKSVQIPAPVAKATVDGTYTAVLDGSFPEGWGDWLYLQPVCHPIPAGRHQVEIEIMEEGGQTPFYLASVIVNG